MPLDSRGAIAIAANAEGVLARDLHQVGSLREDARDFFIFQGPSIQFYVGQGPAGQANVINRLPSLPRLYGPRPVRYSGVWRSPSTATSACRCRWISRSRINC